MRNPLTDFNTTPTTNWPAIGVDQRRAAVSQRGCVHFGRALASIDRRRAPGDSLRPPAVIGSVPAVLVQPEPGKPQGGANPRREGMVIRLPRPRRR